MTTTQLTETSPELLDALASTLQLTFGLDEPLFVDALNTGGHVMVAAMDLSLDARLMGRQAWLTREDDTTWLLGIYDFAMDEEDEGVSVDLRFPATGEADNPHIIASRVAAILSRLGVTTLQGA